MGIRAWWAEIQTPRAQERYSLDQWAQDFVTYMGNSYGFGPRQTLTGNEEKITGDFAGLVTGAYKNNGVIFACMLVRQLLFSEARFQFQQMRSGRPGDLFGTSELEILEHPWPSGTTGDLLTRMEQDSSLAGNSFIRRSGKRLERLRPDWVTIVIGSRKENAEVWDLDTEVIGYIYQPGGPSAGRDPITLLADEVAHYAPIPDPLSPFRGMSWLQPILSEIQGDTAAMAHKEAFYANGATVNQAIVLDPTVSTEMFEYFQDAFKKGHEGIANAYKTLFLGGGADIKVLGSNFQQMDFKAVQGAAETRIASAAGVPPIIVGLSEGLAASTYSNYGQARRRFADGTMRPLWRNVSGSLERIINVPSTARLWYDARDVAFLAEDEKDAADVQSVQAQAIKALTDAGYDADSVVTAIVSGDLTKLAHSGLFSVQLQPPGTVMTPTPQAPPPTNGNGIVKASRSDDLLRAALARPMPAITVNTPDVRVEPHFEVQAAPTPDVHVTTPEVRVEPRIDVTTPDVHIDVQPAPVPSVEVHPPDVHVAAPEVNITTPEVNVTTPDVTVEPHIEVQAARAPNVSVNVPEPPRRKFKVKRDKGGAMQGIEEE